MKEHNPSGSRTYNKLQKSAAVLSIAASTLTLMGGCSRSAEVSAQSEAINESGSAQSAENISTTVESPDTPTQKDSYEFKPTRESWNLEQAENLTVKWDSLSEEERLRSVDAFLKDNIKDLDLNYFDRSPEGIEKMITEHRKVILLLNELSFNVQIKDVDTILKNIISTVTCTEEGRENFLEDVRINKSIENDLIEGRDPYTTNSQAEAFRRSQYELMGSVEHSQDFYPYTGGGSTLVIGDAFVLKDTVNDPPRVWVAYYGVPPLGSKSDAPLGTMRIVNIYMSYEYTSFEFGDKVLPREELENRAKEILAKKAQ